MLDETMSAALERLTENEKVCLRRWLNHQTAKEIALDLGISPHAVEKRLKMARAKLGVTSSLDAARLLEQWEEYGQSGSQASDLDKGARKGQAWLTNPIAIGAATMSLLAASALVIVSQSGGVAVTPRPGEILTLAPQAFDDLDKDKSGYLEGEESPALVRAGGNVNLSTDADGTTRFTSDHLELSTSELRDSFYAEADANGDGRVSPAEYSYWAEPNPFGASTEQIRSLIASSFAMLDKNSSGFIEPDEVTLGGFSIKLEFGPDGEKTPQLLALQFRNEDGDPQAWRADGDTDGDGRMSFEEFSAMMEDNLRQPMLPIKFESAQRADGVGRQGQQ